MAESYGEYVKTVGVICYKFKQKLYIISMNQEGVLKIQNVDQLPVKNRRKTDFFCTLFLTTYIAVLALICIFIHNADNLNRITYPTDNEGKLCGYDPEVLNYPYLYYTSLTDPTKRLCVNQCPLANSTLLSCKPTENLGCRPNSNPKYEVRIYNTYLDEGRIGLFCLPTDNTLKSQILQMSNTQSKYAIFSVYDAIMTSAWTAVLCGIILFVLTHFWPYKVVPWIVFIGTIFSFAFAVFMLTFTAGYLAVKILLCIFFLFLSFLSFKTLHDPQRRESLVVCTRLISVAAITHTQRDVFGELQFSFANFKKLFRPALLIVCFALAYVLFFYINTKQVLSVWSAGKLVFTPDKPFYSVTGVASNMLMIFVGIQIIWGAFFIKQAFNFIASSHSVSWYFGVTEPSFLECAELLLRYHWGSVVGGSLLQGFFYFFELFFNFFWDSQVPMKDHTKAYKHSIQYDRIMQSASHSPVKQFFDLVRGQALAYVSLVNIPYCNAARYCQFLSSNSPFYGYSQTTNRVLRINMHFVPMFIVLCVSMQQMGASASPYSILVVSILSYFIITYFLSYHGEKAQGLLISLYTDEALNDGHLQKAPPVMKEIYYDDLNRVHKTMTFSSLLCDKSSIIVEKRSK